MLRTSWPPSCQDKFESMYVILLLKNKITHNLKTTLTVTVLIG